MNRPTTEAVGEWTARVISSRPHKTKCADWWQFYNVVKWWPGESGRLEYNASGLYPGAYLDKTCLCGCRVSKNVHTHITLKCILAIREILANKEPATEAITLFWANERLVPSDGCMPTCPNGRLLARASGSDSVRKAPIRACQPNGGLEPSRRARNGTPATRFLKSSDARQTVCAPLPAAPLLWAFSLSLAEHKLGELKKLERRS